MQSQDGGTALLDIHKGGKATIGERLHLGPNGTVMVDNFRSRVLVGPGPFDVGMDETVVVYEAGELSGSGLIVANVVNHGVASPGASAGKLTVQGDYFQDDGILEIEIGGLLPGAEFDQLVVNGSASLTENFLIQEGSSTLVVTLIDDFEPVAGDEFIVLTATGGIEDNFGAFELPTLASGLAWSFPGYDLQGLNHFTLSVQAVINIPGDYNGDGLVNATDYTSWRDSLGSTVTNPFDGADGNGDGMITSADYSVWRSNFGRSTSAATKGVAVPEPTSAWLLCLAIMTVGLGYRRSK